MSGVHLRVACFCFLPLILAWRATSWPPAGAALPARCGASNQNHNLNSYPSVCLQPVLWVPASVLHLLLTRAPVFVFHAPSLLFLLVFFLRSFLYFSQFSFSPLLFCLLTSIHSPFCRLAALEVNPSVCLWHCRGGEGGGGGCTVTDSPSFSRYLIKMAVRAQCNNGSGQATALPCLCVFAGVHAGSTAAVMDYADVVVTV